MIVPSLEIVLLNTLILFEFILESLIFSMASKSFPLKNYLLLYISSTFSNIIESFSNFLFSSNLDCFMS